MNIIKSIKNFMSTKFNVYLVIFLILIGGFALFNNGQSNAPLGTDDSLVEVHMFFLPTCPHCTVQKPIFYELKEEMNNALFFEHDASTPEGSQLFHTLATEAGLETSRLGVPTIFVGKTALVGVHSKEAIIEAIDICINSCKNGSIVNNEIQDKTSGFSDFDLPFLGRTDLTAWSLPVLAIVLGLIDGFNPCAMWVLVYLIGILIGVNDKKRIWIIVGTFVLASGILYFLFMTAWLNIFLILGYVKLITVIVGLVALGGGILSLREYIVTKGALVCKVTDGDDRVKTMNRVERIITQPLSWAIVFSMIGLAFLINSVEFACSAAIPAVFTQILALSGISALQNYLYIGLYVFFFMLDDLIIFGMAAMALSTSFGDKYAKYCRLIGGIIMTILGLIMLFAPHLLR